MNFMFVIYFIALFIDKEAKIRLKKEKFFHWTIDIVEMFVLSFLFAAFGWWYYAIISALMFLFVIVIYRED